jgi:transcriptional regulator PpsR
MMTETAASERSEAGFVRDLLGGLDAKSAARVVAAGADLAMIIDNAGIIRDVAVPHGDPTGGEAGGWLDKRWTDTVTRESRGKVEEMLKAAAAGSEGRWREINHPTPSGGSVSLKYMAVKAGDQGHVVALARDQRAVADLQQRLVVAQQTMERDYARLREAESRYRLLFHFTDEAILVVDAGSKKVADANPAANKLLGAVDSALLGRTFASLFDAPSRDAAIALLAMAGGGAQSKARTDLTARGAVHSVMASLFRQERHGLFLIRLTPKQAVETLLEPQRRLLDVLERIPDAFVATDGETRIVAENAAFLELTRCASAEQVRGRLLEEFIGRADLDRNLLVASVREHGVVKNFATVLRNRLGEQENVDVTGVHAADAGFYGFSIRVAPRDLGASRLSGELPRSIEQLSQLIGRVTLKELVRETSDLVERMCIEAALELTGNNRASAAEVLGLSRQSLYSKLHRHGLATPSEEQ